MDYPTLEPKPDFGSHVTSRNQSFFIKIRERTLETMLLVLIIYVRYTAIGRSFMKSKTSSIKKKIVRYTEDFVI